MHQAWRRLRKRGTWQSQNPEYSDREWPIYQHTWSLWKSLWPLQVVWDTEESDLRLLLKWRIAEEVCWGLHSKNRRGRPEIPSNEGSCRRETAGTQRGHPAPEQGQSGGGLGVLGEPEEGALMHKYIH